MRVGRLSMDSQGFTDTEADIDQFCQLYTCDYATRAQLKAGLLRLQKLKAFAEAAKK
jgi:queuine/archaeosine tRNA-ribosyltransferase